MNGIVAGGLAWLVGYLLVYVTHAGSVAERLRGFNFVVDIFGGEPIPTWQAIGWLFYNAHGVETNIPVLGRTVDQNFVAVEGSLSVLYLVPPLLLVAAGVGTAWLAEVEAPDSSAIVGALVVGGYLPLSAIGIVAFGHAVGEGTMAPEAVLGVLLAGIVYPLVFGAIGGVLGGRL